MEDSCVAFSNFRLFPAKSNALPWTSKFWKLCKNMKISKVLNIIKNRNYILEKNCNFMITIGRILSVTTFSTVFCLQRSAPSLAMLFALTKLENEKQRMQLTINLFQNHWMAFSHQHLKHQQPSIFYLGSKNCWRCNFLAAWFQKQIRKMPKSSISKELSRFSNTISANSTGFLLFFQDVIQ